MVPLRKEKIEKVKHDSLERSHRRTSLELPAAAPSLELDDMLVLLDVKLLTPLLEPDAPSAAGSLEPL